MDGQEKGDHYHQVLPPRNRAGPSVGLSRKWTAFIDGRNSVAFSDPKDI
jgi:hypothetical protein